MTSTYDHRIIQGAESGQFLQVVEAYLQGEHGFYEQVFSDLGAEIGAAPTAPDADRAAPPATKTEPAPAVAAEPNLELLQAVQAAMSLIKAHRTHGHLAARLDPLGSEPEGDPALDPEPLKLTPEIMAKIPASILRVGVPGRDARRRRPAPARDLLRHDRLRDRAHRLAPPARLAAREDRDRRVPQAAERRREEGAAAPPDAGRLARALHAQGLPGPEAVLDRGPGHDGPDARRDDPARRPPRARARSSSAWPTAAG